MVGTERTEGEQVDANGQVNVKQANQGLGLTTGFDPFKVYSMRKDANALDITKGKNWGTKWYTDDLQAKADAAPKEISQGEAYWNNYAKNGGKLFLPKWENGNPYAPYQSSIPQSQPYVDPTIGYTPGMLDYNKSLGAPTTTGSLNNTYKGTPNLDNALPWQSTGNAPYSKPASTPVFKKLSLAACLRAIKS